MSFNELNAVEHFIIQKLSGTNLNAADPSSSMLKDDEAVYGSFPWKYRSGAELIRPTDHRLLEGDLREALIRINPEITANPAFADEVIYKLRAIFVTAHQTGLVRANEEFHAWLTGEKTMPFGENNRHGQHGSTAGLAPRHAKLTVGAAATLAIFLFETHEQTK